jgi:hypothetical protein
LPAMRKHMNNVAIAGLCILLGAASHGYSQNNIPSISNVNIQVDKYVKRLVVTYEVFDAEKDTVFVYCKAAWPNGTTRLIDSAVVSNRGSYPAGKSREIIWDYSTVPGGPVTIQLVADDRQPVDIGTCVKATDSGRIKDMLLQVAGIRDNIKGLRHKEDVKALMVKTFEAHHLQTKPQPFTWSGNVSHNIIAHWPGLEGDNIRYLITAHFDTVRDSPGADDNASGIAGLLEVMNILSAYHFRHAIDFIAFDQEEPGLVGSGHYLSAVNKPGYVIGGAFNFDMIGYYSEVAFSQQVPASIAAAFPVECRYVGADSSKGNFVLSVADSGSRVLSSVFTNSIKQYVPDLRSVALIANKETLDALPELAASDHASFWKAGYKALHIGDTGPARNPFYHSAQDDLSHINYGFIENVVKATVGAVAALARVQHVAVYTVEVDLGGLK